MIDKIEYIKENIGKTSRKEIMQYLGIKFQTLAMLMRNNNIIDNIIDVQM